MKAIILGCGLISGRWIRTLAADPRITITALIDIDRQAAAQAAGSCGLTGVPWFPALDAALAADGVSIAVNLTPAGSHARTPAARSNTGCTSSPKNRSPSA
jgi:predicted dehydrogenase